VITWLTKHFFLIPTVLYTIEFQKRGLPHVHIIFWVSTDTSQPTPTLIDSVITAEIPDPQQDPLGYTLVAEHMIHGPCGPNNMEYAQKVIQKIFEKKQQLMQMASQFIEEETMVVLLPKEVLDLITDQLYQITFYC
jgi:hypothetical protein